MSAPRIPGQVYPWPARRADVCTAEAPGRPESPLSENLGALDPRAAEALQILHRQSVAQLGAARRLGASQRYRDGYVSGWRYGVFCGALAGLVAGGAVVLLGTWLGAAAYLAL